MSDKIIKICDTCKKEKIAKDDMAIDWYTLETMELYWGHPKNEYDNKLLIEDEDDPDFCCKDCAMKWFEKQLDEIKTKKYEVKD